MHMRGGLLPGPRGRTATRTRCGSAGCGDQRCITRVTAGVGSSTLSQCVKNATVPDCSLVSPSPSSEPLTVARPGALIRRAGSGADRRDAELLEQGQHAALDVVPDAA